jgi:hypothetical protein
MVFIGGVLRKADSEAFQRQLAGAVVHLLRFWQKRRVGGGEAGQKDAYKKDAMEREHETP